jgi:hypothetical protein
MTFDDGGVNINPNSRYFSVEPLPGTGWKRRALRLLFPKGPAKWMRDQSTRHYTIFPGKENILPADKVVGLDLNWATLLEGADMARLSGEIATVVLGTPHEDYPDPEASRSVARRLASAADLYIRHPREGLWLADPVACNLNSPAEAVLSEAGEQLSSRQRTSWQEAQKKAFWRICLAQNLRQAIKLPPLQGEGWGGDGYWSPASTPSPSVPPP